MAANVYVVRPAPEYPQTWIQFAIVSDERIVWLEGKRAIIDGWLFNRGWIHGPREWPNMRAEQIIAYKRASGGPFDPATERESQIALKWAREHAFMT